MKNFETPVCEEALAVDSNEKISQISHHFSEIMKILGLDLNNDSLRDTPDRVARMYVKEIFQGLDPANRPLVSLFENKYNYNEMLIQKDITIYSMCEHHFVPIIGKAHVAYVPQKYVLGLSKINRIVHYFSKRPQVQERLTIQIIEEIKRILQIEDVAIMIEAEHLCISSRGIQDICSKTKTSHFSGCFLEETKRQEFLHSLKG